LNNFFGSEETLLFFSVLNYFLMLKKNGKQTLILTPFFYLIEKHKKRVLTQHDKRVEAGLK